MPESSAVAAMLAEGSRSNFNINDVPNPTIELLIDPLLHLDKIKYMESDTALYSIPMYAVEVCLVCRLFML